MEIAIPLRYELDLTYHVFLGALPPLSFNQKVAVITNPTVSKYHLDFLLQHIKAPKLEIITIPDGESHKTLATIETILNHCFTHRLDRKSLLIGFGGGVIGDMTGFASSLYQRGIDFIQIPTTLLSQVDASVGGKTGINNAFGKNLIGAFHQPKAVYIDPYFLTTLPAREFAAGVAEIIKMAVTFDAKFFAWLQTHTLDTQETLLYAIEQSVRIKARVVALDEKEQGIRAALNYGHTFGHVIENLAGYGTYLHGEAVAIGMVMANDLAVALGLLEADDATRVKSLLAQNGLPITYEIADIEAFYDLFFLDKKSANDQLLFILPQGIGDVVLEHDVTKEALIKVLRAYEVSA